MTRLNDHSCLPFLGVRRVEKKRRLDGYGHGIEMPKLSSKTLIREALPAKMVETGRPSEDELRRDYNRDTGDERDR